MTAWTRERVARLLLNTRDLLARIDPPPRKPMSWRSLMDHTLTELSEAAEALSNDAQDEPRVERYVEPMAVLELRDWRGFVKQRAGADRASPVTEAIIPDGIKMYRLRLEYPENPKPDEPVTSAEPVSNLTVVMGKQCPVCLSTLYRDNDTRVLRCTHCGEDRVDYVRGDDWVKPDEPFDTLDKEARVKIDFFPTVNPAHVQRIIDSMEPGTREPQPNGNYLSVLNEAGEHEHFDVPYPVYLYVKQMEAQINAGDFSGLRRAYPSRFGEETAATSEVDFLLKLEKMKSTPAPRPRWEYTVHSAPINNNGLDEMGALGWELVQCDHDNLMYFKRRVVG